MRIKYFSVNESECEFVDELYHDFNFEVKSDAIEFPKKILFQVFFPGKKSNFAVLSNIKWDFMLH